MEFNLREFLKNTLIDMVGHKPNREIRYAAARWYDKGNLEEEDIIAIEEVISNYYVATEEIIIEE